MEFYHALTSAAVSLLGLATDYCVKYSALDAANLGFKTHVIIDGWRGVELKPGDTKTAIDEMRKAGVEIVDSGEVWPVSQKAVGSSLL